MNYTDFWVNCDPVILTANDVPEMSTVRFMYDSTPFLPIDEETTPNPTSISYTPTEAVQTSTEALPPKTNNGRLNSINSCILRLYR